MSWVATGIIGGAIVGGGAQILGQGMSNSAANSASNKGYRRALALEPNNYSAGLEQLLGQASVGAGADPDSLALDLITRQVEQNGIPQNARDVRKRYDKIQSMLASGNNLEGVQNELHRLRILLRERGNATADIVDGKLVLKSFDPGVNSLVESARTNGAQIRQNRLMAEQNLAKLAADFPTATGSDIDALTKTVRESQLRELNEGFRKQSDEVLQQANVRGYNPAGVLGELERNRADATFDTQFTAADRALQILTGRQTGANASISGINAALSPARFLALLNGDQQAAAQSQAASTVGQLAAAQSQAGQNAGAGVAAAGSTIGDTLTLLGLLNSNSSQKSSKGPAGSSGSDWFKAFGLE